ncbi:acetyl-CoA carboxylase biotin carboxyl carrier protein [Breznakia pachnodae]|uniref:Biotin carboxyl carrier protein of acetyl-CoA carboxylase n=1 Tax=Breznakia pachnodae TaxID=265178 RepID=A0ABU0DYP9_9FIRM|nr:acetyl-CoA carboxylase biotin carboxyl carrier protein [Breznakia pachnodae]MDQ0359762.1 acetyl-CoA carboxylase biotin carboxyl carrier protein [Breznakia pachnodae]
MDTTKIKQIIALFEESSVAKMDLEIDDIKISLEKPKAEVSYVQAAPVAAAPIAAPSLETQKESQVVGEAIKSPLVGTYYAAPAEGEDTFVSVGKKVKQGDTLCIIEAMKVMNEIKAEKDGTIVDISVKNGDMIQFDDVLMYIE